MIKTGPVFEYGGKIEKCRRGTEQAPYRLPQAEGLTAQKR